MLYIKNVLILFGGNSDEHFVSCASAKSVIENIDSEKFNYEVVGITQDGKWYIFNDDLSYLKNGKWVNSKIIKINNIIEYLNKFDVIFPVMHGKNCEDGKLQGFFELFNIKFVGSKTLSSAICMDKAITKNILNSYNIPQVSYKIIENEYNISDIVKEINFPLIIKPANGGSSIGISKANNKKQLTKAIKLAKKYDNKVVIEKYIKAREFEIAILQNKNDLIVSNPGEVNFTHEFYDYNAKYIDSKSYTIIPDDIQKDIILKLKEYAKKVFGLLNCKDFARIDFFYDEESNNIFVNEVNTIPGFTKISMYPKLIQNEKIDYKTLITILINNSLSII